MHDMIASFLTLNGIGLHQRIPSKNRINADSIPRISGEKITIGQIDQATWEILKKTDAKGLFQLLENPDTPFEKVQEYLKNNHNIEIRDWENFYNSINHILQTILPKK